MAGSFLDTTNEDWEAILGVNLWGVIQGCRLFARMMVDRGAGGHIVNTASAAAFTPSRHYSAYATTKAAVLMLSECLRTELAPAGIGVTAICPGFADTGIAMATRYVGSTADEEDSMRRRADRLYKRRHLTPEKVAAAVVAAVERNQAVRPVGAEARITRTLYRLSPGLVRRAGSLDVLSAEKARKGPK
jgi:NAD(P)-dependent dehydrogenase (short-subunit alcohol dehydrogenase family)